MKTLIVTCDPGKAGASVWGTSLDRFDWAQMPETLGGLKKMFAFIEEQYPSERFHPKHEVRSKVAFMEKNTGFMAGMKTSTKRKGEEDSEEGAVSAKSMFSFGRVTGHMECAFEFSGFALKMVSPLKWMNAARVVTGQKSVIGERAWKNHLKEKAQERFPGTRVTLANADALLMFHAAVTGALR